MKAVKPWIIQKYGGTSLGKYLDKITEEVVPGYLPDYCIAIVCSALSSTQKSAGTTTLLLSALELATDTSDNENEIICLVDKIRSQNLEAIYKLVAEAKSPPLHEQSRKVMSNLYLTCDDLSTYLLSINAGHSQQNTRQDCICLSNDNTNPKGFEYSQDRVLAVGEILAAQVLVLALAQRGIQAEAVVLDDIVQHAFLMCQDGQAESSDQAETSFLQLIVQVLRQRLVKYNVTVPVITGYFGRMPNTLLKSIGRGYTDVCAALCAVALGASGLQIWKEVDGMFSADPNKIPSARLLPTITPEEAAELTLFGNEVIHPLAIRTGVAAKIPILIKNVLCPQGTGTIILPHPLPSELGAPPPPMIPPTQEMLSSIVPHSTLMKSNGYHGEGLYRRVPTAVTSKERITVVNVISDQKSKGYDFMAKLFARLEQHKIEVDLIATSLQSISLAISVDGDETSLVGALSDLKSIGTVTVTKDMAIISVIGHRMQNTVGVAGEIFSSLAEERINIYLIGQGASEINIS